MPVSLGKGEERKPKVHTAISLLSDIEIYIQIYLYILHIFIYNICVNLLRKILFNMYYKLRIISTSSLLLSKCKTETDHRMAEGQQGGISLISKIVLYSKCGNGYRNINMS